MASFTATPFRNHSRVGCGDLLGLLILGKSVYDGQTLSMNFKGQILEDALRFYWQLIIFHHAFLLLLQNVAQVLLV